VILLEQHVDIGEVLLN